VIPSSGVNFEFREHNISDMFVKSVLIGFYIKAVPRRYGKSNRYQGNNPVKSKY
jgi:hypothetical protein